MSESIAIHLGGTAVKETDWKELRIKEYAKLEKDVATIKHENKLIQQRLELDAVIKFAEEPYFKNIEAAQQQQAGIKLELAEKWDTEDKTFKCNAGTATLRTTKSLRIKSKEKLVNFLTTINKLPDFIKGFETAKLRKIKDAGLLGDEIVSYDEKKSIAIKLAEVEQ